MSLAGGESDPSHTHSYHLQWQPKTLHVFVVKNGETVSHTGLVLQTVTVDDRLVSVAGIGGVLTRPDCRGRGFGQMSIKKAEEYARQHKIADFGLLFCTEAMRAWYERLGWSLIPEQVWIDQPEGIIRCPLLTMEKSLGQKAWPGGAVRLGCFPWWFQFFSYSFTSGIKLIFRHDQEENEGEKVKRKTILHASEVTKPRGPATATFAAEVPLEGMMAEERRTQILQIVRNVGRVRVNELAVQFNTSGVTIRNDLNELHQRGLVLRSHGGAVLPDTIMRESPIYERMKEHAEEKRRIGAMAATMINDGETVILDSGTTTLEIARQIKKKQRLQIITNGVNIAAELLDARGVEVFIVGGTVRGESASISGRFTEEMLGQFSADKMFLSGSGCELDFGVSGANLEETMVNRVMLQISREIILVADASKFSKRSMSRIAAFSEIDTIVSDTSLSEDVQSKLRSMGCDLILV